jgi:uncharacterized protein
MPQRMTVIKRTYAGEERPRYSGYVVLRNEEEVVLRCVMEHPEFVDLGPFAVQRGDLFMEHYYRQEWFNILAIYAPPGVLKGWYCNLAEPAQITAEEIRWRDLALDLLVLPDGRQILRDEDEFEAQQPSAALRAQAERALAQLRRWVREKHRPFGALA